jgi:hypothetical protein
MRRAAILGEPEAATPRAVAIIAEAPRGSMSGAGPPGPCARWTAAALFGVEDGKLTEVIKEWDKLSMWEQLGWPLEECLSHDGRGR